ncbi:MAG: hypothetical protein MJ159_04985 [Treponemataceae bacterium]|nr:hypothetical protein [Treponemataceae bacterium]
MKRLTLLMATVILIISAICFNHFTKGLISHASTYTYQDFLIDRYSSTNDNAVISFAGLIFAVALVLQIARFKKEIILFELIVYYVIGIFELFLLFLSTTDGGSLVKTIIFAKNICLFSLLASLCIYFVCLVNMMSLWLKKRSKISLDGSEDI